MNTAKDEVKEIHLIVMLKKVEHGDGAQGVPWAV